jgi:uncharacterized membrane protein
MSENFCDCCGKEIPNLVRLNRTVFANKRVSIDTEHCDKYMEDFLVELIVTANIYKPVDLNDEVRTGNFVGNNICKNCIVETLTQE